MGSGESLSLSVDYLPALFFKDKELTIIDANDQFKNQYSNSLNIIGCSFDKIKQPIFTDKFVTSSFKAGSREYALLLFDNPTHEIVELIYDKIKIEKENVHVAFINEVFSHPYMDKAGYLPKHKTHSDIAFLVNNDGKIQQVNQRAILKLGYSKNELLQSHLSDIICPTIGYYFDKKWDLFLSNGSDSGELILENHNAELLYAEYRAVANVRLGIHLVVFKEVVNIISNAPHD